MRISFIILLFVCAQLGFAQSSVSSDSVTSSRGLRGVYDKVTNFFDSTRVKGHDPRYIEMPKRPWSAMVQTAFDQTDLVMVWDMLSTWVVTKVPASPSPPQASSTV